MDTLRRRRRVGLALLAAFIFVSVALNGWRLTPIWALFDETEGTFAVGDPYDEWIYAVCNGEEQQITVLANGRVGGVGALESLRNVRFPDWCDLPTVDNPDLAAWQAELDRLVALTAVQGSSGAEILDIARGMPVSSLYLKPISDWVRREQDNAISFLDAVAERPMRFEHPNEFIARARRDNFLEIVGQALQTATAAELAPGKVDYWLATDQIAAGDDAWRTLARAESVGVASMASMLERLEQVPRAERAELYMRAAPRLVVDSQYAALLSAQLRYLPREPRARAARELLRQPDASLEFPIALLSDLGRSFRDPDIQLEVFTTVADKLRGEGQAPLLLTRYLREVDAMQRRLAAAHLLSLDAAGETAFALSVLRSVSELHPASRSKLIHAVLQSRQFADRSVQEACLLAIQLETRGPEQQELLDAMLRHEDLHDDLRSRIRAAAG